MSPGVLLSLKKVRKSDPDHGQGNQEQENTAPASAQAGKLCQESLPPFRPKVKEQMQRYKRNNKEILKNPKMTPEFLIITEFLIL